MPTRPGTITPKYKQPNCYKQKRTERQFETNDRRWRLIRSRVLAEEPLCRECERHDMTVPANEVDHINGDPMDNRRENLQALCKRHHSAKTMREVRERGSL